MLSTSGLILLLTLVSCVIAQSTDLSWVTFDRNQFTGNIALDTVGDVQLFWKSGDNYSTFGIASRSNGYLGLGFSETGAMTGADMAIGRTENGNFVFENRHAEGFITPQVSTDQKDNMRLIEGHQSNGSTSFIFEKRNKADCLETQSDINDWQWFIYAFSDDNTFAQHAAGNMGKQYVKLTTGKTVSINEMQPMDDVQNFTVLQPEVTIPTQETTYCYSLHKMPAGKKNYLLAERPTRSSDLLHHLVLYSCHVPMDDYMDMLGAAPNCDYENFSNPCNGFVTEWAPGMSGRTFESGYGKPFGSDYYEYVMFETHYNNPNLLEGVKDSASYTLLWNDKPVTTEIGTLTLGDLQVEGWFLEPGKQLVKHSTVCTPECTDRWPSDGITAVSVFHHMHYRGRNAEVQIIRDGKEIAPLSTLRNFEYGYQFSKSLNSIQLLPGDKLITTCEYNTMNDTQPVPGGLPSKAEMCFAWVDYYPANNVLACTQIDMGESPDNPLNGTAALCMTDDAQDVYPSSNITSPFQALPASGDTCAAQTSSQAAVLKTCPETDVCFSFNVPEQAASSEDIYFQISAPTTYSWVALAQGTMMSNANMFVMYSSADGKNVTLSPRTASGHVMPTHHDADISLLEGTGISDGKMIANVRCSNCSTTMSLQGTDSNWVYAHLKGSPLNSDDVNAPIAQHDIHGTFQWDVSQATGGSGGNPFIGSNATTSSSSSRGTSWQRFADAHGALASLAFVGIFPVGAILVRLGVVSAWIHGGLQLLGLAIFIAAAGIGIYMANGLDYLSEPHAIIGLIVFAVFFFMPFFGVLHHNAYKKVQHRTSWSYVHIFTGRVGIILALINGGLGLKLASAKRSSLIAYGVIAGLMGAAYIAAIVFGELKRGRKSPPTAVTPTSESKHLGHRDQSSSGSASD